MRHTRRRSLAVSVLSIVALGVSGAQAVAAPNAKPRPSHYNLLVQAGRDRVNRLGSGRLRTFAEPGEPGEDEEDEAENSMESAQQYAEARLAPGIVAPGAYSAAWAQFRSLPRVGGDLTHVTGLPYDSDDPRYRDISSNSSGGSGYVTGRITAIAADDAGNVYAGGADGGVFRSRTGGGRWESIADGLPTLSSGDLQLDAKGRLWYATGEANTGATSFVGTGVYLLTDPAHGTFSPGDRVGGTELESTTINALRFAGDTVWAATNRGVFTHSIVTRAGPWKLEFAPNPDFLPGGTEADDPDAPYKNITNDIAIDPKDPSRVLLAVGWRSGDAYNGFYAKTGGRWIRVTDLGDLPSDAADVGNVTFARSADGSRYYAIDQSPTQLNTNPDSALQGFYVSRSGSPFGPWTQIADYHQLAASGSALTDPGYMPGIQAWYNQFLQVDPANPEHVYAGLEEVYETKDGGAHWTTPGPYWNFSFPCWDIDPARQTGDCNPTTHSDQHSVAIGTYHGKTSVYVGNDGGIYRRPVDGVADADGHAKDWTSLNDGTIDTLQYYSVGVGRDGRHGVAVTGGLQDNGQSILRPGDRAMGSNFGGDGGDTIADPDNGCDIAAEYVYLAVSVTNNCAVNDGSWTTDPSRVSTYDVAPPDADTGEARFIAPLTVDATRPDTWVAGGRHVWVQTHGFAIRSGDEWTSAYDLGEERTATAVAASGGTIYAGWCGPCNNQGFARGIAVGKADGTGWHELNLPVDGTVPNRYVAGFDVDPANAQHVYVAVNGFSRKFTEGPGAGIGHVFESRDGGTHWTDISANLPDVPANSVKLLAGGGLVLGTDLGLLYRAPGHRDWAVLGRNLPSTAVLQVKVGPDDKLYVATHGRGIWSLPIRRTRDGRSEF
ncbi:glycosyl hydrolase [Micromonospora sp. NPDC049559]|uniref:glycosyl hydrolase n=1 Tax=Micromonospora sp. NPDC049559 TaxID=3155923 RepID=UPI0034434F0B